MDVSHQRYRRAVWGLWLSCVLSCGVWIDAVLAADASGAYSASAQRLGGGVNVRVDELMGFEAKRRALNPTTATDLQPSKREYEFLIERRRGLPNAPQAARVSAYPDDAADDRAPLPNSPQTVGISVLGVGSVEAGGFVPPDSHGAVGDTQVLVAANLFLRSFNKATGAADGVLAMTMATFFSPVSGGAGLSDPRVKFDPISRRWFVSIITTSTTNRVLLAVSSGSVITGTSSFTFFSFAATDGGGAESQTPFADYDTLGIDAKGVYIGVNMFNTAGTAFLGSTVYVINKAALLAPTPSLAVTAFRQLNNGSGAGAYTPYVADNADPAATAAYLVGTDNASFGLLVVRRITGADTLTPAISANLPISVPTTSSPLNVPVLGRTQTALDALDDRLFEAKVSHGRLWTAHNIQVDATGAASNSGGRTGSRWYEITNLDTTPVLLQAGTLYSSATTNPDSYWIPSIGITGQGHAAIASSVAGAARFPEIAYAGRLSGDTLGTLRTPTTAVTSSNSYTVAANRWGDYSHTATDPNDNMTLWTFQEYAPTTSSWGVRAIQLRAPPPATVTSISPNSLAQGQTQTVVVTGTSTQGSAFYDPPANFPNRLLANFGTGVTVNAVLASSPTSATFSVTVAAGTSQGSRNVQITNPDGQFSVGANLLTITPSACPSISMAPASLPSVIVGVPYSQSFVASPAAPYTYTIVGTLPSGLSLLGNTLSGTPTTAGTYNFVVIADNGGCTGSFSYSIAVTQISLAYVSNTVTGGNGVLDPNECNTMSVRVANNGNASADPVSAVLSSSTPGVSIVPPASSSYPAIAPGSNAVNDTLYQVSTSASLACQSTIQFNLAASYPGGTVNLPFSVQAGVLSNTVLENFDAVTAPALPAGWTTQQSGAAPAVFATSALLGSDSAPNVAFTNGASAVATNSLVSAPILLPAGAGGAVLNFRHAWNFESTTSSFDGGVLELSTDGGSTFNDVTSTTVGGSFLAGGYTGTVSSSFSNPLAGRPAWARAQTSLVTTTLRLPAALDGQTIRLRFRAGFDSSTTPTGAVWRIDTLTVREATCTTGPGVCSNPPTQLAFSSQPTNSAGGALIDPVVVRLLDSFGVLTSASANVTLAIANNPGGGTLSGATTVAAVNGVATFSNLSIDKAGAGYTLAASSPGLTGVTSNAFDVSVGPPAQLAFATQPSNGVAGALISPAVTVRLLDAGGNLTNSTANVGLAIATNPGGGTLSGGAAVAASAGVATFNTLSINAPGIGYRLAASSQGLPDVNSAAFDLSASADLSITKTNGTTSSVPGGATTYTITAGNAGPTGVASATVSDTFPASLTCTWTCAGAGGGSCTASGGGNVNDTVTLPAGGSVSYIASCSISAAATGTLSNTATVSSAITDPVPGNNSATDSDTLLPSANLGITKTNGTTSSTPGTNTTYTITASNAGPSNTSATVADTFPASLTCTWTCVGAGGGTCTASGSGNINQSVSLPAGGSVSYTASCSISAAATGTLSNTATVSSAITDPFPANNSATDTDTLVPSANLSITKTNGTTSSTPGTNTTYTITASNAGPSNVTGATVADTFPASLTCTWTCVGAGGGTCTASGSGNLSDTVNLPSGGAVTYTASCAISASATGTLSNTATVSSAVGDPTPGNNSATDSDTLSPQADLSITKTDGATSVNAGTNTVYTISASNAGPSNATATVADTFPAACVSPSWTCVGAGGGSCTASGSGNLSQSVTLPVGGSVTFTATCPINSTATGTLSNTATVAAGAGITDPSPGNNSATDTSTIVAAPVLSINSVGLTEGDSGSSNLQFTVTRTTTSTAFDLSYATANGTAIAGSDYTSTSGTLSFTAGGAATQTINVPITGETLVEGSESFALTLSNPTGTAQIGPNGTGTGTITDNDSAVVNFSAANVSQSEGSSPMTFTVTLSNPVQSGVTLTLNSTNGTAGAADYTPISGATVSFAANSNTSQTVNVIINNDALDEDDETYSLTLSNLAATGNVSLGTATANATILDDDATPTLSISSPSQNEGNSGSAPMNFTVSLSAISGRAVSFTAATANGTATAPSDYLALAATPQTIPAGQSSISIPVTINGDTAFEGNESFSLNLSGISNATPPTLSGTGTILEDDQQPTTTVISSDLPDPSVVGQSYPVAVTVTAQSSSPTGTVSVSDGSASCTITLTVATSPTSTGSCNLTSTTAGAKTLTASYTASSSNFGNSSGTTAHQVNPAATTISVSGPARSRINQPTSFTAALAVTAPGAGTPTGTITLTSGASSCTATLPTTSCDLTFTALGSRTVTASYASDGNYASASSSGAGNTQTLVYALSDLAVTKTDAVSSYRPGELLVYTVTVRNLGPDAAAQIRVRDAVPPGLLSAVWTCDASGGAVCPATGGTGDLDQMLSVLPVGGLLNFTFYGNAGSGQEVLNTALIELPADTTIEDPVLGNNTASDLNLSGAMFRNGYEDPAIRAESGRVRLPAAALLGWVDETAVAVYRLDDLRGDALRVYARRFDDRLQYALAVRNTQGQLRLGPWQSLSGDPLLSWTASSAIDGWVLTGATLE